MQHLRALITLCCALVFITGGLPDTPRAALAKESKESMAGHWHLVFYGKCVNSPANLHACTALQSPATFPIMGRAGTVLIVKGVGDYVSDARGRFTVRFVTDVIERAPGAAQPAVCTDAVVFDSVFNGTCEERGIGRGHIAPGRTGMPDFWEDETSGAWNGSPPARFYESTPTDTSNPACPEVYDTRKFMALLGFKTIPAGISARVVLIHRSR